MSKPRPTREPSDQVHPMSSEGAKEMDDRVISAALAGTPVALARVDPPELLSAELAVGHPAGRLHPALRVGAAARALVRACRRRRRRC
jgi:hypothetical protein